MKEETHLVIIEVLATTVEVITSKYDKRGIENRRQYERIEELNDEVARYHKMAVKGNSLRAKNEWEIARLEGYNSEAIKKIKEKRGFLECIHDKCVNTGVVDIMDKNAMSNVDELIEAFNNRADEVARLKGSNIKLKSEYANCRECINHYSNRDERADKLKAQRDEYKAKASKLTAEKRKLMELIREEVKGGYTGTIRVLDNYKAWQRAQRKTGK